jgi:hypothetical protein
MAKEVSVDISGGDPNVIKAMIPDLKKALESEDMGTAKSIVKKMRDLGATVDSNIELEEHLAMFMDSYNLYESCSDCNLLG